MSETRKNKRKKASIKRIVVTAILVIAVVTGLYAILTQNDESTEEDVKIHKVDPEKSGTSNESTEGDANTREGTVTNEASIDQSKVTEGDDEATAEPSTKETTTEDETNIAMPTQDKDAIIANAKTQVYTIYTDLQQGSGFLVNTKGDILTNAHVAKDASYVFVTNEHGQEFQGEVIGISDKTDVALIRVPDLKGKNPLVLDTAQAAVDTPVLAIGSPGDQGGTTTEGKITSVGAEFVDEYVYKNLYEITAKLASGSSGGPLVNANTGNVIGINSIILTDHPEVGYAIQMSTVMPLIEKWAAQEIDVKVDDDIYDEDNPASEAYFAEDLLKDYLDGFYELFPYAIRNTTEDYYTTYILPKSDALTTAKNLVKSYSSQEKKYKNLTHTFKGISIYDEYSTVDVKSVFTYKDSKTGKQETITESITYKVIIDEYGDYQITGITINSVTDTGNNINEEEHVEQQAQQPKKESTSKTDEEEQSDTKDSTDVTTEEETDIQEEEGQTDLETNSVEEEPETEQPETEQPE